MLIALDFPPQASFRFQIPSVEVHRDIRDSDELSRQIATAKVGRYVTRAGYTRRTLLDLFDLGTYLRAFAYLSLLYVLSYRRSPGQATLRECFSDARDPRVQLIYACPARLNK
jgi:hypothetical protein